MFKALAGRPLLRAAATSTVLMGTGDVLCQCVQQRGAAQGTTWDWGRTARMAFIGGSFHGPFFFHGMRALDRRLGDAQTLRTAVAKSALGQLTLFPTYTTAFFLYAGMLEGMPLGACVSKLVGAFPMAFATGTLYWPLVNTFTFQLRPDQRIAFLGAAGIAWNGLLSFLASRDTASARATAAAAVRVSPAAAAAAAVPGVR